MVPFTVGALSSWFRPSDEAGPRGAFAAKNLTEAMYVH